MREVILMWRSRRMAVLTLLVAVAFTAVLLPFKQLAVLPGFTSIRPANVLPVVFGLLFGPAAAWGSLLGNLAGDLLGGTWSAGSWFGAVANFFTAFVAYRLWGNLGWLSSGSEPDMQSGEQFPEFVVVAVTAGFLTASIVGWGHELVGLLPFSIIGGTIVFNNSLAELFLGPPLLYLLYKPARDRGLLYHQILSDASLPPRRAVQARAALALVVLSVLWFGFGMGINVLVDGVSLRSIVEFQSVRAPGSPAQVVGGTVFFGLVCLSSAVAGERLSALSAPASPGEQHAAEPPSEHDGSPARRDVGVLAIAGLGVTLTALYVTKILLNVVTATQRTDIVFLQLGVGLVFPGLLFGAAWWLHRTDLSRSRVWKITLWTFGGLGVVTVLSVWQFSYIFLGVPISGNVMESFLLNVQAGAVGGLVVGWYDARAESASEALEETRENYSVLGEKTHDGVAIVQDGVFRFVNPQMATLCGREESDILGTPLEAVLAPEYRDSITQRHEKRLAGEPAPEQYEVELLTPAGTRRYVDLQVKRISHDGRPAVLVTAKDITDWKELEAQLRTQRDNVELLNQVLRHDVMNEMDLMMQIARRCESDLETDTSVEHSYPEQLLASGERVIDLLEASQTLTDVVSELHLDRKPIPLAPLLEREVAVVSDQHPAATVRIEQPLSEVSVRAQETLESVIRNLLSNAVEHNDADDPEVVVSVEPGDTRVLVRIADDGPGIPDDRKSDVFDPDVGSGETPTSGLGLYLVDALVSQIGGDVWIEDNRSDGSVFCVTLDRAVE
jgi:energy-coupling factor transport system substrate-specific component